MSGTPKPGRVVDAHVHIWDAAREDRYPYLGHIAASSSGDGSRMLRRFDVAAYRAETDGWNVDGFVNVAAANGLHCIDETLELDRDAAAAGGPAAIIGGLPRTDTAAEAIEVLDRQLAAPRFRGVRAMGGLDRPVPEAAVLAAMRERGLVLDLMAHPDQLEPAAARLAAAGAEAVPVVVEHTGWPRSADAAERDLWRRGIDALAALGDHVSCKLSGLSMPFGAMRAEAFAPWIEPALEAFGVDRCLFASNFPVDAMYGTFDELYTAFAELTATLDDSSRDKLFAANAERVYRIG